MNTAPSRNCPVCLGTKTQSILRIEDIPILCNALHDTKASAIAAPRGDIDLHFCHTCTHLFNAAFDSKRLEFESEYEHSLHFSTKFQRYVNKLASRLIDTYELQGKCIVEIGAGQGEFLQILCANGRNTGIGFDPTVQVENAINDSYHIVKENYDKKQRHHIADLICCRHVLGSVPKPRDFIRSIHEALGQQVKTPLYVEVPHAGYLLEYNVFWDILYEDYSYFTPSSLVYLMQMHGFSVTDVRAVFDRQFLSVEAFLNQHPYPVEMPVITTDIIVGINTYTDDFNHKVATWQQKFKRYRKKRKKVVVWGAGSKGSMFLNILKQESPIEYVIDINPRKQQKYLTGTGQKIEKPTFLKIYRPDEVIVMSESYAEEIEATLHQLGCDAKIVFP